MGTGIALMAVLVGALVAVPLLYTIAGELGRRAGTEGISSGNPVATDALSGVVKSVDATMLVVTQAGKSPRDMTFVLRETTLREGPIRVGALVQIRFRTQGRTHVATAVLAFPLSTAAADRQ